MNIAIPALRLPRPKHPLFLLAIIQFCCFVGLFYLLGKVFLHSGLAEKQHLALIAISMLVVLGGFHNWLVVALPIWRDGANHLLRLIFTFVVAGSGALAWLLILDRANMLLQFDFLPQLGMLWFSLPFCTWLAWKRWLAVPVPQHKVWSAAAVGTAPSICFEEGNTGVTVVAFGKFIPRQVVGYRLAMPTQHLVIGSFFQAFAHFHNGRTGSIRLPLLLSERQAAQWQFYQRHWLWGRRYFDPERSFEENRARFRFRMLTTPDLVKIRVWHTTIFAELIG